MPTQEDVTDERVHEIARAVINEMFLTLGVDATEPQALIELQHDFKFIRSWRESKDTIQSKGLGAAVVFVVTAALAWLTYEITGRWFH